MSTRTAGLLIVLAVAAGAMPADGLAAKEGTAPASSTAAPGAQSSGPADAAAETSDQKIYTDYMRALHEDMRASASPEQRALAEIDATVMGALDARPAEDRDDPSSAHSTAEAESLATLAAAEPSNHRLQWIVAMTHDERAIARVQESERDNGAAWALSLPEKHTSDPSVDHLLDRIASSTRYDPHFTDAALIMLEAMRRRPVPDSLVESESKQSGVSLSADTLAKVIAFNRSLVELPAFETVMLPCHADQATPMRRNSCVAIGRLMLDKGPTLLVVNVGVALLKRFDALDDERASQARRMWWWWSVASHQPQSDAEAAYLDDILGGKTEIEAQQSVAIRVGQAEPPADWQPPKASRL